VLFRRQIDTMGKLRESLAAVLRDTEPDVVVSCYPVYAHLIQDIFREHAERPFRFITVVTDSISVCSAWYRAPSDLFVVANEPTANVLVEAGIPKHRLKALGFPVSPIFAQERPAPLVGPRHGDRRKVLFGKELRDVVEEAFAHKSRQWQEWCDNLDKVSRPDANLRIAELVLEEAGQATGWPAPLKLFEGVADRSLANRPHRSSASRVQLCDFHIHTNYSDGRLTLPEVINFYGSRGFDCICVTDHVTDILAVIWERVFEI
jgi:hypothetical protein